MSTVIDYIPQQRFATLARMGERVFHIDDLANIFGITNANTLHVTLSRYVRAGLLRRVYRGLYAFDEPSKIDPLLLGAKALHRHCYVTTETVLTQAGAISQRMDAATFASNLSKQFVIVGNRYRCRQLADRYLYNDEGMVMRADGVRVASVERAAADILYFAPTYHFDNSGAIDWERVRAIGESIGYPKIKRNV